MGMMSFNRMRKNKVEAEKVKALEKENNKVIEKKEEIVVAKVQETPITEGEIVEAVEIEQPVEEEKPAPRRRRKN